MHSFDDDDDDRTRLLDSTHRLQASSRRLEEARQIAIDTEHIAEATLVEVRDQGNQLRRIKIKVHDVDESLSRSRRILNNMMQRAQANKCVLYAIMIVASAIIVLILVLKLTP